MRLGVNWNSRNVAHAVAGMGSADCVGLEQVTKFGWPRLDGREPLVWVFRPRGKSKEQSILWQSKEVMPFWCCQKILRCCHLSAHVERKRGARVAPVIELPLQTRKLGLRAYRTYSLRGCSGVVFVTCSNQMTVQQKTVLSVDNMSERHQQ